MVRQSSGGAGNRTRVLRYKNRASTGVVRLSFSQFRISYTRVFDKLICENVLRQRSQRRYLEEPSSGARSQIEGESGLTDHRACLGSKGEIIGSCTDDYFLHRLLVNEIILASSARFPYLNNQSRDRSPPWVWKALSPSQ